jgi:two-component system, LuxR family, response regulator FixJ
MFTNNPDKGELKHIAARPTMERPRVTIIYRDDATRASMRFLLEVEGWEVCDFKSPAAFLENPNPRCLVLDQDLPGMTGLALAEELRSRGISLRVVLITERYDTGFLDRAKAANATAVDAFSPADVIEAIRAIIATPLPPPLQAD